MSEILIGLLSGMLIVFVMGVVFGWFIQYINSKRIRCVESDIGDIYRYIDEKVGDIYRYIDEKVNDLDANIINNVDMIYKETDSIRSMVDSRLDKMENKINKS